MEFTEALIDGGFTEKLDRFTFDPKKAVGPLRTS